MVCEAKKYVAVRNGKWSDIRVWRDEKPSSLVSDTDEVIIEANIVLDHDLNVHGLLRVEHGGSLISNSTLFIYSNGTINNTGNMIAHSVVNKGAIFNYKYLEVISDIDNTGHIANNSLVMAGNNIINQGGKLDGMGGRYFANNTLLSLDNAAYGLAIKICKGE
jgi:hypothetical protein